MAKALQKNYNGAVQMDLRNVSVEKCKGNVLQQPRQFKCLNVHLLTC